MIRVLLVLAGVALALWWLRRALRAARPDRAASRPPVRAVPCARCGVYLPAADALHAGDRAYCCAEHRDAGPAAGPP